MTEKASKAEIRRLHLLRMVQMRLSQNDGNILLDSIEKGNFQIEMEGMDNKGLIYKLTLMPVTLEICGKTKPEEETVCFPMIAMRLQRNSLQTPVRIA